ncbi:MAG: methylisocitrate lyase [Myxococcota bacterium]
MSKGNLLREKIKEKRCITLVGAHNAFMAKLVERAGFDGSYLSGAGLSNSYGVPDTGILKLEDFTYAGKFITDATSLPVISDADTGFDDAAKTVAEYIKAGIAGLHIEDQVFPKRCGHLQGKEVVEREEMIEKLKLADEARKKADSDFVIIARCDARGASNIEESKQFQESVERGKAYLQAGADAIFIESLRDKEEFKRYRKEVEGWLLANMTEFGKTPYISYREFAEIGYNIVIFPVTLFRYLSGRAVQALKVLKEAGHQGSLLSEMLSRQEINDILNYKP